MDTQLEASDVSKDDKIHLLLNRGFLATVVRSSDERVEDSVTTINSYFNQVMELTKDEKEKYIHARQKAVFGLLYSFVNHSFSGLILPEKYRVQFFKEKMTEKEIQQAYFRSIIFYYNDTSTTSKITDFLSEDKVFLGTRMVTLAAYLSSFKDQMPKEEVATLQQSLTRDLDAYTTSHKVIFDEAIRSELIPSGQRAFAFDTLITSSTTKLSSQQNEQIDATYNNVRHDLGVSLSDDPISLSIIGMMNDSYQLASMKRRFGEKVTKQKDYPNVVASLINNILHSDETKNAASFLYRVGLFSSSETWFIPGKYFSQAVKENKQLQGLLTSLGASLQ